LAVDVDDRHLEYVPLGHARPSVLFGLDCLCDGLVDSQSLAALDEEDEILSLLVGDADAEVVTVLVVVHQDLFLLLLLLGVKRLHLLAIEGERFLLPAFELDREGELLEEIGEGNDVRGI
jgi:hypothetical protein